MAYGQSKLANILHAKELAKRLKVFPAIEMLKTLLGSTHRPLIPRQKFSLYVEGKEVLQATSLP